jgi:ATP-dependent Clp protease protease subunit
MNHLAKLLADNRRAPQRRFEVKALADDSAEVFLYDAIVSDSAEAEWFGGVAPEPFVAALRGITAGTIHLRINSPGGSVFGARAIEQALRDHPARVVAHIDGLAASAATFIAMAADEVVMAKGALFMVHKAWTMAFGNSDDLLATADLLDKIDGTLVQTYADRTKQTPALVEQWMAAETWFTAAEAIEAGFADRLADDHTQAQAAWNLSAYAKAPKPATAPTPEPEPQRVDAAALTRRLEAALLTV